MSIPHRGSTSKVKPKFVTLLVGGKVQRLRHRDAKPYREGIVSCTPATPIDGTGKTEIKNPPDDGNANITVSFHDGATIPTVSLELLFWGNAWTQPSTTPTASQVIGAVQNILAGPYMSGLSQYGVGFGTLRGAITVLSDPSNPFSRDDWHNLIWDLIDQGTFPEPDDDGGRNLYLLILPPGVNSDDPNVCGKHGYPGDYDFPSDYDRAWAGFVLNDGNIDTITTWLSHELVEACTDPEDDGWTIDGRSSPSDEIGDVCQKTVSRVNGVMVQGYWSQLDRACIIPLGIHFHALTGPAVFGRGGPDITGGKKSIYVVTTDNRLVQLWDTDFWNLDFPAEQIPHRVPLLFKSTPAVISRGGPDATGGKKSIYAVTTDGRLVQLWDTTVWNLDFPAEAANNGQFSFLRFQDGPAVFSRGGPDATGGKKSIYAITTDGRLVQLWDTDVWNLDFPVEAANNGQFSFLRFQGRPAVFSRGGPDVTGGKKSIYAITTDGQLVQLWDTTVWNLDFPAGRDPVFHDIPAVFDREIDPITGDKKSIYAIRRDGALTQLWDTTVWNMDIPTAHF